MKLVCLNIWKGNKSKTLLSFFQKNANIDIFCLQEVLNGKSIKNKAGRNWDTDIFKKISEKLPLHKGVFNNEPMDEEGNALFVKSDILIKRSGFTIVHKNNNIREKKAGLTSRILQWEVIEKDKKSFLISHLHGLWHQSGVGDVPERIKQSNNVKAFLDSMPYPKIFCGDLNLAPSTESMAILKEGMRELVTENKLTSTRSKYYASKNHIENMISDYMFVSKDIRVNKFKIIRNAVSDHLPLFLDFY